LRDILAFFKVNCHDQAAKYDFMEIHLYLYNRRVRTARIYSDKLKVKRFDLVLIITKTTLSISM